MDTCSVHASQTLLASLFRQEARRSRGLASFQPPSPARQPPEREEKAKSHDKEESESVIYIHDILFILADTP